MPKTDYEVLADAVNEAWSRLYGQGTQLPPAEGLPNVCKLVKLIADDVQCGQQNFSNVNAAMVKMDAQIRQQQDAWGDASAVYGRWLYLTRS